MRTILIADDTEDIRELLHRHLEHAGYTNGNGFGYRVVDNGRDAYGAYLEGVDLVILDNLMPELTGMQVAERIRRGYDGRDPDPRTPIIVASGTLREDDERFLEDLGVTSMRKPYCLDMRNGTSELVREVETYLGRPNGAKSGQ